MTKPALFCALAMLSGCCHGAQATPEAARPAGMPVMTATPPGPAATPALTPVAPGGKACQANSECGAGEVCAFAGGCDAPRRCVPARLCTQDLVPYCGCDGQPFKGSSTCPDRAFAKRGACGP